jgi:hypothetical protein
MIQHNRGIVYQPFDQFAITVGVTPTPISTIFTKSDLIDSFIVSVDAGAANNIFIGNQGVTVNTGIEIVAGGGGVNFIIENQNQHYEIQDPVIQIAEMLKCNNVDQIDIPFIVWDLSQIYLVAIANTTARIIPFRSQFI